jgi:hypothetical protein
MLRLQVEFKIDKGGYHTAIQNIEGSMHGKRFNERMTEMKAGDLSFTQTFEKQ